MPHPITVYQKNAKCWLAEAWAAESITVRENGVTYGWQRPIRVYLWSKGQFFKPHCHYSMGKEWSGIGVSFILFITSVPLFCSHWRRKSQNLGKRRRGGWGALLRPPIASRWLASRCRSADGSWRGWSFVPLLPLCGVSPRFFLVFIFCDWDSMARLSPQGQEAEVPWTRICTNGHT